MGRLVMDYCCGVKLARSTGRGVKNGGRSTVSRVFSNSMFRDGGEC